MFVFNYYDATTDEVLVSLIEGSTSGPYKFELPQNSSFTVRDVSFGAVPIPDTPMNFGSVVISLDDGANVIAEKVETVVPFTLFGDSGNDIFGDQLAPGLYTLTATPFTSTDGTGPAAGPPQTLDLEILDPSISNDIPNASLDFSPFFEPTFGFSSDQAFEVTFFNDDKLSPGTIDGDEIEIVRVFGGPPQNLEVTLLESNEPEFESPFVPVVYNLFDAPIFDASDNGIYEIRTVAGSYADVEGDLNNAEVLGIWTVQEEDGFADEIFFAAPSETFDYDEGHVLLNDFDIGETGAGEITFDTINFDFEGESLSISTSQDLYDAINLLENDGNGATDAVYNENGDVTLILSREFEGSVDDAFVFIDIIGSSGVTLAGVLAAGADLVNTSPGENDQVGGGTNVDLDFFI